MKANLFLLIILFVSVAQARTLTDIAEDIKANEYQFKSSLKNIEDIDFMINDLSEKDRMYFKSLYGKKISELEPLERKFCSLFWGRGEERSHQINCAIIKFRIKDDLLRTEFQQISSVTSKEEVEKFLNLDDKQEISLERKIVTGAFWVALAGILWAHR